MNIFSVFFQKRRRRRFVGKTAACIDRQGNLYRLQTGANLFEKHEEYRIVSRKPGEV